MSHCLIIFCLLSNQRTTKDETRAWPNTTACKTQAISTGMKLLSGRALSKREAKAIVAACKHEKNALGTRDGAMIGFMLATGLRRSEVIKVG